MSDQPKFVGVELVAVTLGFYQGAMVHPGRSFSFTGNKLPRWAKVPAEAAVALKPKAPASADTKPAAAQAAVKAKASSAAASA